MPTFTHNHFIAHRCGDGLFFQFLAAGCDKLGKNFFNRRGPENAEEGKRRD